MGVIQNTIDINKLLAAGLDPTLGGRVTALEETVGDSSEGLVKDVSDLETVVGDNTAGLVKEVTDLGSDVSDLETVVGDNTDGLVKQVNDISEIVTPKLLTSADDLNDIKTTGFYVTTTTPANTPDNRSYYAMIVLVHSSSDLTQIIFCANNLYTRKFSGVPATWGAWTKFSGTTLS